LRPSCPLDSKDGHIVIKGRREGTGLDWFHRIYKGRVEPGG